MFLVTVHDLDDTRIQINGASIAYFRPDPQGKGSVIAFAAVANGALLTMRVTESADTIAAQINAKLRK